jgi:hypothetical protein
MAVNSPPRPTRYAEDPALEIAVLQLAKAVSGLIQAVGRLTDKQKQHDSSAPEKEESRAIVHVLIEAQRDLEKAIGTLSDE